MGQRTVWLEDVILAVCGALIVAATLLTGCAVGPDFKPPEASGSAYRRPPAYTSALINLARNFWGSVGISFASTLVTRRAQFHQSRLVEGLQPLNPAFNDFTRHLGQAVQGTGLDVTAETYHATVQQASLLSYLDAFRAVALIFLLLLPLLLLVRPGAADASAHAGGH